MGPKIVLLPTIVERSAKARSREGYSIAPSPGPPTKSKAVDEEIAPSLPAKKGARTNENGESGLAYLKVYKQLKDDDSPIPKATAQCNKKPLALMLINAMDEDIWWETHLIVLGEMGGARGEEGGVACYVIN